MIHFGGELQGLSFHPDIYAVVFKDLPCSDCTLANRVSKI